MVVDSVVHVHPMSSKVGKSPVVFARDAFLYETINTHFNLNFAISLSLFFDKLDKFIFHYYMSSDGTVHD